MHHQEGGIQLLDGWGQNLGLDIFDKITTNYKGAPAEADFGPTLGPDLGQGRVKVM
jgi:hypothetical protein